MLDFALSLGFNETAMPRTKSAKKALRQNVRRRSQNIGRKNKIKETVKGFRRLIAAKKSAEAKEMLPQVYKTLDKMAKTGLIKRNKAARLKSRLAKRLSA